MSNNNGKVFGFVAGVISTLIVTGVGKVIREAYEDAKYQDDSNVDESEPVSEEIFNE